MQNWRDKMDNLINLVNIKNLTSIKMWVFAIMAAIGSFITTLIGGWDSALITLCIFMAIDYITGLVVAGVFKNSNKSETGAMESRAGFNGIIKKVMTLLFVLMGNQLDIFLSMDYIRYGLIIAFLINETTSIIENAGLMGIPLPDVLVNALDILKKKGDSHANSNR